MVQGWARLKKPKSRLNELSVTIAKGSTTVAISAAKRSAEMRYENRVRARARKRPPLPVMVATMLPQRNRKR